MNLFSNRKGFLGKIRLRDLFIVVVFVSFIGALYILTKEGSRPVFVDLGDTRNITDESNDDYYKIGVSAMISPKETLSVYEELVDYIGEKLEKKIQIVQRKTYAEMNELVKNKDVLAAFVCSRPYVQGNDDFGMELIAAPQMYNETSYYSYIIVPKDSPAKSMQDLKGKKFAFTDPNSNTGKLVPTYILGTLMNETPETFFGEYVYTLGHDNSINAVAKKLVDGAAVDHLFLKYFEKREPLLKSQIKIIEMYGPYCMPPLVTHPDTAPEIKDKLADIVLNMHNDEKGRKIIQKIEIQNFAYVENSCYDSVREMVSWEKDNAEMINTNEG